MRPQGVIQGKISTSCIFSYFVDSIIADITSLLIISSSPHRIISRGAQLRDGRNHSQQVWFSKAMAAAVPALPHSFLPHPQCWVSSQCLRHGRAAVPTSRHRRVSRDCDSVAGEKVKSRLKGPCGCRAGAGQSQSLPGLPLASL